MSKSLVIDPLRRKIYEAEISSTDDFRKFLPGGLCVAHVFSISGDVLYVDDEGLLRPPVCAFRLRARPGGQPFMSFGIVQGRDMREIEQDGELKEWTSAVKLTPKMLEPSIEWLTVPEALEWFRRNEKFPALTICSPGETPMVIQTYGSLLRKMEEP